MSLPQIDQEEASRMHQTTFDYLLSILRPHLEGDASGFGKQPISPEKQLYIALYVLGTPDSYRDNRKPVAISKVKQALSQFCAIGAKNLLLLTFGSSLGFPTILIPELQKSNPVVPVTLDEVTWIGSINLFLVPLGGLISGPLSQRLGRRRTMMITTLPFVLAWLIFYYAKNVEMLFIGQALTGLTGGLLEAPVMTYVAEVTQPHLRGMLSATTTIAVIVGVFTQMLTGSLVHWRTVALINIVYPVACFIALAMVPESPPWLIIKGKLSEAEKALCWLRGWVTPENITEEFQVLCEYYKKPRSLSINNSDILNLHNLPNQKSANKTWCLYKKRTFYKPFILITAIFFISAFGGLTVLQVFAVIILDELKTPIDKYTATVLVGVAQVVGGIVCACVIHFTGKRKLSFFSIFTTGLSLLLISTYGYLIRDQRIDTEKYVWIPTTLMVASALFSHVCFKSLPWILAGEVFPADVRSFATGLASSMGYIFSSVAIKLFLYMKNDMTLPGTFLFYAVVNFAGVVGLYFMLPETEGRTLQEIEEHFAGIHSLDHKPGKEAVALKEKWIDNNPRRIKYDDEN